VALVAIAAGAGAQAAGFADGLEADTINLRFDVRHTSRPPEVVVVAIDDLSFSALRRQWPFPRSLHARAIDRLRAAGARTIVYDVQFTEPTTRREDLALYRAVARARGVILATTEVDDHGHTNVLGGDDNLALAHAHAGASNVIADDDGVVRRFPYAVSGLKSLAVVTVERARHRRVGRAGFSGSGALIDYRGPAGAIRTVSFSDLVEGKVPPRILRGKIVVVGASAPTLHDVHPTPMGGSRPMPGPEVQANAIWTALHGVPLREAPSWVAFLTILVLGLAAPLLSLRLGLIKVTVASAALFAAYLGLAQFAFSRGLVIEVVRPLGTLVIAFVGIVIATEGREGYERRRISRYSHRLEAEVAERTRELRETQLEIIRRLGQAAESRDEETGLHIERIGRLCEALGTAIGMPAAEVELLRHASAMHDIGKIGIPDRVLLKPGSLDPEEWEILRAHTTIGASILSGSHLELVQLAEQIARTHHERWDGSGYPAGLRGEEIPLAGRICAVCDVFDALVSERPYKEAWTLDTALAELALLSGSHLDPRLVDAFLGIGPELFAQLRYDVPAPAAVPTA
jgi:CHASE2 domain-containing sensor protein